MLKLKNHTGAQRRARGAPLRAPHSSLRSAPRARRCAPVWFFNFTIHRDKKSRYSAKKSELLSQIHATQPKITSLYLWYPRLFPNETQFYYICSIITLLLMPIEFLFMEYLLGCNSCFISIRFSSPGIHTCSNVFQIWKYLIYVWYRRLRLTKFSFYFQFVCLFFFICNQL